MSKQKEIQQKKVSKSNTKETEKNSEGFFAKYGFSLFIFLISFLVYVNSIPNDYNLDDELVTQNHRLTAGGISAIPDIFTEPYYKDKMGYSYEYRPIVLVSFAIEHEFFGDNPHVSHFFNVLLYALLCLTLYRVVNLLLGTDYRMMTFVAATIFALHPIHTEVVASIKSRDEILSLLGGLLALRYALKFNATKKWIYFPFMVIAFVFGLLSKLTITPFLIFIPMAIAFFRTSSLKEILLLSVGLALPLFFLVNINLLKDRVIFLIGVLVLNCVLFILKNGVSGNWLKHFSVKGFLGTYLSNTKSYASSISFRNFYQWQSILLSIIILGLAGLNYFYFIAGNNGLFLGTLFIIGFSLLLLNWEWKLIVGIGYISMLLFYLFNLQLPHRLALSILPFPLLFFGLRSKGIQRILLIAFAIGLTTLWTIQRYDGVIVLVGAMLVLFYFQTKTAKYQLPILIVIAIGQTVLFFLGTEKNIFYFNFLFVFLLLTYFSEKNYRIAIIGVLAFVLLIPSLISIKVAQQPLHIQLQDTHIVGKLSSTNGPAIIAYTNRPLNFVEIPVGLNEPLAIRLGTGMDIFAKYLKLIFAPYPMSFYYGYKYIDALNFWNAYPIAIFLMHLFIAGLGLYFLRKRPIISFSIFVYLISLASVSTVVSALPGMMADRYLLIPSIGFSILVSYLLLLLSKNPFNGKSLNEFSLPLKAILLLICIAYSGITIARNFDWKDRVTLFSKDIENVSNSAQARNLYAVHLALKAGTTSNTSEQTKWREEACVQFKKALDIYPEFMNASFDLGRTLVQLNRYDEAMAEFKNTIRIKPTFSEPYSNIAVLLDAQNKFAEAIPYYKKAIEIRPKLMVYANLSFDYFRLNDFENSLAVSRDASKDFPNAYQPYFNMAKVFMRMGARDSAIANFEKAYRYNENDYSLVSTLYAMYAERNDPRASYFGERLKLLPKPQTGNFINQK